MLEQRQYSRFFINDPADVRSDRQAAGKLVRVHQRDGSAVFSKFVEPIWKNPTSPYSSVKKSPDNTTCCNLSEFSTSSMPYYDGVLTNRDNVPTADEEVEIS
jgi:hypothetical protein